VTVATQRQGDGGYVQRGGGGSSGLADVIELILDKGLVIDIFARVSLVGIELITIDVRIVVASVDTFLRFAEATNRLDLYSKEKRGTDLPGLVEGISEGGSKGVSKGKTSGVIDAVAEKVGLKGDDDEEEGDEREPAPRRRPRQRAREREG
jgi:gas vesicle structural protein